MAYIILHWNLICCEPVWFIRLLITFRQKLSDNPIHPTPLWTPYKIFSSNSMNVLIKLMNWNLRLFKLQQFGWGTFQFLGLYSFMHKHPRHKYFKSRTSQSSREQEMRPCFLIRFSVICWRVGRRPKESYVAEEFRAGRGAKEIVLLSAARLFTFSVNSWKANCFIHKYIISIWMFSFEKFTW